MPVETLAAPEVCALLAERAPPVCFAHALERLDAQWAQDSQAPTRRARVVDAALRDWPSWCRHTNDARVSASALLGWHGWLSRGWAEARLAEVEEMLARMGAVAAAPRLGRRPDADDDRLDQARVHAQWLRHVLPQDPDASPAVLARLARHPAAVARGVGARPDGRPAPERLDARPTSRSGGRADRGAVHPLSDARIPRRPSQERA